MKHCEKKLCAFTLVEILVVLAIIAVLAAILFPVFATAKRKAKQEVCASNLHQISAALQLYLNDHDGAFPAAVDNNAHLGYSIVQDDPAVADGIEKVLKQAPRIQTILNPYLKNNGVWYCPMDLGESLLYTDAFGTSEVKNSPPSAYSTLGTSYAYHFGLGYYKLKDTLNCTAAHNFVNFDYGASQIGTFVDNGEATHAENKSSMEILGEKTQNMSMVDGHIQFVDIFNSAYGFGDNCK